MFNLDQAYIKRVVADYFYKTPIVGNNYYSYKYKCWFPLWMKHEVDKSLQPLAPATSSVPS